VANGESRRSGKTARTVTVPAQTSVRLKRRQGRRGLRVFAGTLGFMVLALCVAFGLLYVRLLHGSVSLAFLAPMIESSISEELGGRAVRIETAEMRLVETHGVIFALRQVTIRDTDGATLVAVPEARARLSASALKRGRLALEQVELLAPRLNLSFNEDGTLALSFQRPSVVPNPTPGQSAPVASQAQPLGSQPGASQSPASQSPASQQTNELTPGGEGRSIDLLKAIAEASSRARRRETASGYLRLIGASDAVVVVGRPGQRRTLLNVPDLQFDLDHRRARSLMSGKATISSLTGPVVVGFSTFEAENADHLNLDVTVRGLNPRGIGRMLPGMAAAEPIDLAFDAEAKVTIGTTGIVRSATLEARTTADASPRVASSAAKQGPDAVAIKANFDGATGRFDVPQFFIDWAGAKITMAGHALPLPGTPDTWSYALRSTEGILAPAIAQSGATRIDHLSAIGTFVRSSGQSKLQQLVFRAGGAEFSATGEVTGVWGQRQGTLEGRLSPMSVGSLKAIWPVGAAPQARRWVVGHVAKGQLSGGTLKAILEPGQAEPRLSMSIETTGVEIATAKGVPPIEIPRALVRIEGNTVELTAPDMGVTASEGRKVAARGFRFTSVETTRGEQPTAELSVRLLGSLGGALDIVDRDGLQLLKTNGISLAGLDGKIDGRIKATFPLGSDLQLSEIKPEGHVRLTEVKSRQLVGGMDVTGGTVTFDIGDKAVDVKGDLLVRNVAAKLAWQYLINQPAAVQPPIRVTATLDTADRNALGLDLDDVIQREVQVETVVSFAENGQLQPKVRLDLTKADLMFEPLAWRKPPGRPAIVMFDPVRGPGTGAGQRLELQNMRISGGDDLAAEGGWIAIGGDNKVREFSFPVISLNTVSRLSAHGKLRPDNVWDVKFGGETLDGRDMFRIALGVGPGWAAPLPRTKTGIDMSGEISTMLGFNDATLRNVRMVMSRRPDSKNTDKLTALDVSATLEGNKPFRAQLQNNPTVGRQLLAQGADAGQVLKLVGFYPNAIGGNLQLEVNLDAKGLNEKSGILWVDKFAILGDPVVSEVFQNADQPNAPAAGAKSRQRVVRQQMDFDILYIPFDIGSGQFVLKDAILRGPLIGASMRGKIDFRANQVDIGGTYAPLSGLNVAFGSILGPLTGGAQGDGVFGITFAVTGSLSKPTVVVNPLSLLAPGIFREIFQMAPQAPRVTPRHNDGVPPATSATRAPQKGRGSRDASSATRLSSEPAVEARPGSAQPAVKPEVSPSWPAEVKPKQKQ
jgi:AsmA-like C-terminal region